MKIYAANPDIMVEGLWNPTVHGRKGELICSYIGAVEIVVGEDADGYVTDLYLAVQIPTGQILGVDEKNNAFSLSNQLHQIHWGYYPVDFSEEQKTTRPCPKVFKPTFEIEVNPAAITTIEDLPF